MFFAYLFLLAAVSLGNFNFSQGNPLASLKTCPRVHQKDSISDVDSLLGEWYLSLVVMDEAGENFQERSACIRGKILRMNETSLLQIWELEMPEITKESKSEIYFPTDLVTPQLWRVESPLGGEFKGTVVESRGDSHVIIIYCAKQEGMSVHIMTVGLTRTNVVGPKERLDLLETLVQRGYNPFENKIISWSNC